MIRHTTTRYDKLRYDLPVLDSDTEPGCPMKCMLAKSHGGPAWNWLR